MASVTAGNKQRASKAALNLEIALGKKRIALSELNPAELQALLTEQLNPRDMKDLRGFKELREILPRRGDEVLNLDESATLNCGGFSNSYPFTLKSHVVPVCRGCISQTQIYRRHESDEETTEWKKYNDWGRSGYLHRGEETLLLMRRPLERYWEEHLLAEVTYSYTKVPNEKRWAIGSISALPVAILGFCKHFRQKAPDIARDLLWELTSIYRQTAEELENKARTIRLDAQKRERLSDSIA